MQQFYGIGESDDKPIPPLKSDRSTPLQRRHARALKVRLSPLFSSSPSEGSIDQIPEQLRKMKKLTFKGVQNPETRKVMDPYCPLKKEKSSSSSQQGNDDPSSQQNVNPNQNSDSTEPVGASDPSQEIHYQVKKIFPKGSRAIMIFSCELL